MNIDDKCQEKYSSDIELHFSQSDLLTREREVYKYTPDMYSIPQSSIPKI